MPTPVTRFNYKTVAASQTTAQIVGPGGFIHTYTVMPASSGAGTTSLIDGSTTVFTTPTFAGGAETKPYTLTLNITAESTDGFKVTTGASVSVLLSGRVPGEQY
jgi:hypothetical protein